jgi:hypothetical protein
MDFFFPIDITGQEERVPSPSYLMQRVLSNSELRNDFYQKVHNNDKKQDKIIIEDKNNLENKLD